VNLPPLAKTVVKMASSATSVKTVIVRQVVSYFPQGYPPEVKQHCLSLYLNGMGFRGIERSTGVSHNTVINAGFASRRLLAKSS
jgi:hypothetical protein